ncbi:probable E3 ubiquitin-protein ligase ATL45 [Musa acuminata AAA Group]|uniref:probable E3 ubiquitin-protein ligase ATL45 n=1 Tax=Musa acuminata AAA Group TaxID=214697 RepID=UPI0031D17475
MGVGAAVLIAVAACVLLVIGALYVRCVSRRFNATVARNSPPKITGLGSPSIAALPTVAYQRPREDRGASRTLCSVCLGAMSEGELVRVLPACAHVFHVDCIDAWLRARATCPVCRSDLKLSHLVDTGESEIPPPPPSPPISSTTVV